MDKVRKYIIKHLNTTKIVESQSTISTYFYLSSGVAIRVSDHIGLNSKSAISIVSTEVPDTFVVYTCNSNKVASMQYEQVKQMINTLALLPDIIGEKKVVEVPKPVVVSKPVSIAPVVEPNTVFGWDISLFKVRHQKSIRTIVSRRNPLRTGKHKTSLSGDTILGIDSVYFTVGEINTIRQYVQVVVDKRKLAQEALKKNTKKAVDTAIQAYAAPFSSMYVNGIPFEKFSSRQQVAIKTMAEEAKLNQQNNPVKNVKGPFILGIDSRYYTSEQRKEICNFMMSLPK